MTTEIVEIIHLSDEDKKNIHAVRRLLCDIVDKSCDPGKREDARVAIRALTKVYVDCSN